MKGEATNKAVLYTMVFQTTFFNLLSTLTLISYGNKMGKFKLINDKRPDK